MMDEIKQEIHNLRDTYQRYLKNTDGLLDYAEWLEKYLAMERIKRKDMLKDFRDLLSEHSVGLVR